MSLVTIVVSLYKAAFSDELSDFRSQLTNYVRLYSFLVQIITFVNTNLERLYVFCKFLLRVLPTPDGQYLEDILHYVDLDSYRVQQMSSREIALARQKAKRQDRATRCIRSNRTSSG